MAIPPRLWTFTKKSRFGRLSSKDITQVAGQGSGLTSKAEIGLKWWYCRLIVNPNRLSIHLVHETMSEQDELPRWLLYSLISSLLCVCGALCVPLISYAFRNSANTKLVNYGLSLSAGSMMTTALYKMLPSSDPDEANGSTIFFGVLIGMCLSLFLNYLVHARASESLVHCAHDSEPHQDSQRHSLHTHQAADEDQGPVVLDPHPDSEHIAEQTAAALDVVGEQTALLRGSKSKEHLLKSKQTLLDLLSTVDNAQMGDCCDMTACVPMTKGESFTCIAPKMKLRKSTTSMANSNNSQREPLDQVANVDSQGLACLEHEIGYDFENLPVYRENFHSHRRHSHHSHDRISADNYISDDHDSIESSINNDSIAHAKSHHHHHHHLETPFSKLLSIGLQTCIVITLHKFPEGFIIYYTNQSSEVSKALGFSIFLSLSIHNFVEGFSMTLPFYAAFENKFLALLITSVLGGCSQPLGALIGYLIFKDRKGDNSGKPHMDAYLSITAGFLLVIGLQMFQTGIGFSQGHHHHEGEGDKEIKENHTSVNTCLKWCCIGVLLILASGLFKS